MSSTELNRRSKRFRILCATCQQRKARFAYRGEVRADRDHTLCFECYRGEINRARARRMTERATPLRLQSPFGDQDSACERVMDVRQLAHRRRMLDYLQRAPAVAS